MKVGDHLSSEHRSWNMSRIRSTNTKPEMTVRSLVHRMGYRFRLHRKDLPGKPDLVLPKYKAVIFVHGCFWHRHRGCKRCTTPVTNEEYWLKKLKGNAERDKRNRRLLKALGWKVIVIWECEARNAEGLRRKVKGKLGNRRAYSGSQKTP
ncbi:MAG: DNA mismatch endonuclease Vsr [Phycisphaerae bacterium]|nr:DNA mismatch endonuclease Vsr [Phycisphaerae bacterium]